MTQRDTIGRPGRGYWRHVEECIQGHALTVENTYAYRYADGRLMRSCRECRRRRKREAKSGARRAA